MKSKMFNLKNMYFILLFILLEVVLVSALTYNKDYNIQDIEDRYIKRLNTQLKSVISFYSTTSTIVIGEILNNENIKSILIDINTNNETKQKELRNKLLRTYKKIFGLIGISR